MELFKVDFYKAVAIAGNGVDFFFVISGFCMYLMTGKKQFTLKTYVQFLYRRFLRIAPAFYAAVFVYAIFVNSNNPSFPYWYTVFFHLLFLNNVVTGNTISVPFWSIGVECQFYILLPYFIILSKRISIIHSVILLSLLSILFFAFVNLGYFDTEWWLNQVVTRFPEFGCGIIAASLYLKNKEIPGSLRGPAGLFAALIIMYAGRAMMFGPFLARTGSLAFVFKSVSYTVMTAGFSFLMFHVITLPSFLSKILSSRLLTYLGKISYSIYLWHSLSFLVLWKFLSNFSSTRSGVFIVFVFVSILTVVIAHISYIILESFYFKKTHKKYNETLALYAN